MNKVKNWFSWNFNFLFFSTSQKNVAGSNYGKTLFGKEVEYTEMRSPKYLFDGGRWKDYKFVGIGSYLRQHTKGRLYP